MIMTIDDLIMAMAIRLFVGGREGPWWSQGPTWQWCNGGEVQGPKVGSDLPLGVVSTKDKNISKVLGVKKHDMMILRVRNYIELNHKRKL